MGSEMCIRDSDDAANTIHQVLSETLGCRTDETLETRNSDEADIDIRDLLSWSDWVNVFAYISSTVSRIVLLARTNPNLKQAAGKSVDTYRLRVTQT